ncbi:35257_t:CDS:2, partial [Racocetra persica]
MLLTTDCSSSPEITSKYFTTESAFSSKQNVLTLEERRLKKKRMLALTPKKTTVTNSSLSDYSVHNQLSNNSNKVTPTITMIVSDNEENTTQNIPEQIDVNKVSNTNSFDFQLMKLDSFSSDNSFSSDYSYENNNLQSIQQTSVNKNNILPTSKKPSTKSNRRAKDDLSQPCLCVICGKDLTGFNIVTRETHLNRCLDDIEKQENEKQKGIRTNQHKQVKKPVSSSGDRMFIDNDCSWFSLVTNCPCCLKSFPGKSKTAKSKITHMKRCGDKQKFSATKILSLLKEMKQKLVNTFVPVMAENSAVRVKDTQLTDYFTSVPKKEDIVTTKPTAIVSQTYSVSALEGTDQDDDFKSNVIITSISTVETIGKRKFREDTDDDFRVAKVLSKSMLPQYINQKKKIVYDLGTTPILAPAESIKRAQKRAKKMFFDRPTIHDIAKSYPLTSSSSFCTSGVVKQRECRQFMKSENENGNGIARKKSTSLWEIQAIGGPDSQLSDDDYMTDMLKEWPHKLDQYYLQPFRKRYEMCDRCVNKYWGRLQPENEERDEMIER